jgi:hypothetical protein
MKNVSEITVYHLLRLFLIYAKYAISAYKMGWMEYLGTSSSFGIVFLFCHLQIISKRCRSFLSFLNMMPSMVWQSDRNNTVSRRYEKGIKVDFFTTKLKLDFPRHVSKKEGLFPLHNGAP